MVGTVTRKRATKGKPRKATKRTAKRVAKKRTAGAARVSGAGAKKAPAKRRGPAGNPEWKRNIREGQVAANAIDRYLAVLGTPRRRIPSEKKLARLAAEAPIATGLKRVELLQQLRDAEAALIEATGSAGERKEAEDGFILHAKIVSEKKGISYATWRDVGVPASMLKRAGIAQTRL